MIRRFMAVPLLLAAALALRAGDDLGIQQFEQNVAVAPQQVRRAEPPPPDATASQLEITGDTLRDQKDFPDALDYYQAALKKPGNNNNSVVHNKMGIAALQMLRYDLAKKEFERATHLDHRYAEAYNNLGVVHYIRKSYRNAIKNYEKAIELRQDSASFHSNLATAYFARKEFDKANQEYLRALEIDPDVFEHRGSGGIAAHLLSPEDRAHYDYVLARMYAHLGNAERSLTYLKKAMEEGYSKIDSVFKDEEFATLRKDPRFAQLMAARPMPIPN